MIGRIWRSRYAKFMRLAAEWAQSWLVPALLRRRTFGAAIVASFCAAIYWGVIASDRYVSEAQVIIQDTNLSGGQVVDFSSIFGGLGGAKQSEQMLLRTYLLSFDMLEKLDASLDLRGHYSDGSKDIVSRLWARDVPQERFYSYYLSRVTVDYDVGSGVLVIKAQAYDGQMAHRIAMMLVSEGERYMNLMAHRLAQEQVSFIEQQVKDMSKRAADARQALIDYQNRTGMASPENTAENIVAIINRLETQLSDLQAKRSAMLGYLMPDSASSVDISLQISAIEKQIEEEKKRIATPVGSGLNLAVEEYQRLLSNVEFTQDMYKTALVALEKGRIEATRTLKKVSVVQQPTLPQYSMEPRRLYSIVVFLLVSILLAGVIHLIVAIIRDHQD